MSNPEPVDGKCNAHPTQDGGYCALDEGHGTENDSGPCRFHGGRSTGPKDPDRPVGNTRALTHGVQADPAGLFASLDDVEREWVEQWADAWRERAGLDEDDPTVMILRLSAVRFYQSMVGERVVNEAGNEYERTVAYDEETKEEITNLEEHYLSGWADRHMKSALRALKDVPSLPGGDEADGRVDGEIVARFERIAAEQESD